VLLGTAYAARRASHRGISPDHIWNGVTVCIVLGIIGARLYHVFSTPAGCTPQSGYACGWPWYRQHPGDIIKIWNGGLGIYGAIAGGVLAIVIYARHYGLSILSLLDLGGPGLALGQAIGRWGNFINQELYGPPTGSSWFGVRIEGLGDTLFHPTFLYESLWCLALFIVLAVLSRKLEEDLRPGDIFAGYAIGYGVGRFWIEEFFRPDAWIAGPLAAAQWVGLILIAVGVAVVIVQHRRPTSPEKPEGATVE
jgi:phosphatidylglycerol:prolipoprotein diacylglycerol transferase